MPVEVQSAIREVKKLTSIGYKKDTINTDFDKLFLPSEIEVFGTCTRSFSGEGHQYEYYTLENNRIKKTNDSATTWWLRSPHKSSETNYCAVSGTGEPSSGSVSTSMRVSFAFCF